MYILINKMIDQKNFIFLIYVYKKFNVICLYFCFEILKCLKFNIVK